MSSATDHEPTGRHQTRKATASGWIGSALEYYDFFIYATAASLIFPQIFFPKGDPTTAIIASLATYGVGYVARPIGAFFLGHWGDTHGRKQVLIAGQSNPVRLTVPPGVVHGYKNLSQVPGLVFNCPNRLYAGPGKQGPVDEIRHEGLAESPFVID